jgi:hypothetical protein
MGCTYTGSAGGPIRTEMPTEIWAGDAVENDKTETDNTKTPNTSQRRVRFIVIALSFVQTLVQTFWPKTGKPA